MKITQAKLQKAIAMIQEALTEMDRILEISPDGCDVLEGDQSLLAEKVTADRAAQWITP